jgi:hypothetical protein
MTNRLGLGALLVLPAALIAYMSFRGGGFFPRAPAIGAIVVVQFLIVYVSASTNPFGSITWPAVVAIVSLAAFALWILVSRDWSGARARSLVEFDRALLYVLVVVLFALVGGTAERLRWAVRVVAGTILVIGTIALITRILPDLWPTSLSIARNRLKYPLSYWNALGLFCAIGTILCFHLTCQRDEPAWIRVVAAGGIPLLTAAQYFTFSRGALAAIAIAVLAYVTIARPRSLLSGALAVVPTTAVGIAVAYHANLLASENPTTEAAKTQGHHVALGVGLATLAALGIRALLVVVLDRRQPLTAGLSAHVRRAVDFAPLGIAIAVFAVLLANGTISRNYDALVHGPDKPPTQDLRARLFNPANNGRADQYRAAVDGFRTDRLKGTGAGTYQLSWERYRPDNLAIVDAHSLYVETLSELGLVGLAALLVFVFTMLVGIARRARGPDRPLYAAAFAVFLAWALHAGVDWDWEMPAVTLPALILGALALGNRHAPLQLRPAAPNTRLAMGLASMACLAAPVFVSASEARMQAGVTDFVANRCPQAQNELQDSLSWVGVRPEPFEAISYCNLAHGYPAEAIEAAQEAQRLDPENWQATIAVALARASNREDPRPLIGQAIHANPRELALRSVGKRMRGHDPQVWHDQAYPALTDLLRANALALTQQ